MGQAFLPAGVVFRFSRRLGGDLRRWPWDGPSQPPGARSLALPRRLLLPVIAAGGISSLGHLKVLKQLGAEAAILGKALYTGDIGLKQALDTVIGTGDINTAAGR